MTYPDIIARLGIERVCLGGCGLNEYRHRGTIYLGVIHWRDRSVTRRGLRRFLLLVARREREESPDYLNTPDLRWYHLWHDEQRAEELAQSLRAGLGQWPVEFSAVERARCRAMLPRNARPAIRQWATR